MIFKNLPRKKIAKRGHMRRTKTKPLLKGRYWFPKMNNMIDRIIDQFYKCKVESSNSQTEPIKPAVTQEKLGDS